MPRARKQMDLSRRIVGCYLLFCLIAVVWLAVSIVVVSRAEPNGWAEVKSLAQHAPIALLVPIALLAFGGVVLYRMARPLATIDSQLRDTATSPAVSHSSLRPVSIRCAAALGWNRLVDQLGKTSANGDLNERLSQAITTRRDGQADKVLDSLPDGVATTDSEGSITFANRALAALLASDEQDGLVGSSMSARLGFATDMPANEQSPEWKLADPANAQRATVTELHRPAGNGQRILRVARHPVLYGEQTSRAKHVWSVRDVTQTKLADKMRDDFLDSATHELRTPLTNIKAYSEALALSEVLEVEQQKDFCNTINSEVTRLARLIDDLLSISSLELGSLTVSKKRVEFERLIADVAAKVAPLMEQKEIDFQTVLPEKLPALKMDKDKIAVALVNLLGNAAKYTPIGGRVALKVRVQDCQLIMDVEDTGTGISSDELPRVFDKFFRSADSRIQTETGTGLGLSLAQEVVRSHGGLITATSELDKGSTFTITLPLE